MNQELGLPAGTAGSDQMSSWPVNACDLVAMTKASLIAGNVIVVGEFLLSRVRRAWNRNRRASTA